MGVQIVCKCDPMAGSDLFDFVLTVTVKCSPLDFYILIAPVVGNVLIAGGRMVGDA